MLKTLLLTNFGKHRDLELTFERGLTVIRGENEAGKSTALAGWMYNWFGSALLPATIDEQVTHGEKKASLKTKTTFSVGGKEYVCTRGASGAELTDEKGTVLVTNHASVTVKIEKLFGIPAGKAQTTIFAAQNEIRGVLALGPTAVAAYIEKLADFSEIDQLLQRMSTELLTGSTKPYDDQIEAKEQQLEALGAQSTPEPGVPETGLEQGRSQLTRLQEQAATAAAAFIAGEKTNRDQEALKISLTKEKALIAQQQQTVANLMAAVNAAVGVKEKLEVISAQNSAKVEQANTFAAYQRFLDIPAPRDVWEGDLNSAKAEVSRLTDEESAARVEIRDAQIRIKDAKGQKLTDTVCPYTKTVCTQLSDPDVVKATNDALDKKIAVDEAMIAAREASIKKIQADAAILTMSIQADVMYDNWTYGCSQVVANTRIVPRELTWVAAIPIPNRIEVDWGQSIGLDALIKKAERAQTQLEVLPEPDNARAAEIEALLAGFPKPQSLDDLQQAMLNAKIAVAAKQRDVDALQEGDGRAGREAHYRAETIRSLQLELVGLKRSLGELNENNELIKAVRAGRIKVAELLWSKVLAATSVYFSQMRGVPSIVTLTPKGFAVNGGLVVSGSTFDILGLALRVTTVKLFSDCGILLLDEANAGADNKRSFAITGVLSAAGFDQVIFATHKDVDEAGCDNLIII